VIFSKNNGKLGLEVSEHGSSRCSTWWTTVSVLVLRSEVFGYSVGAASD
jgi:hypothetical protein